MKTPRRAAKLHGTEVFRGSNGWMEWKFQRPGTLHLPIPYSAKSNSTAAAAEWNSNYPRKKQVLEGLGLKYSILFWFWKDFWRAWGWFVWCYVVFWMFLFLAWTKNNSLCYSMIFGNCWGWNLWFQMVFERFEAFLICKKANPNAIWWFWKVLRLKYLMSHSFYERKDLKLFG